jgi:hypothetical protein
MNRVAMIRRPHLPRGLPVRRAFACGWLVILAATSQAADLPPDLVAEFTRRVQPLVLNRCAAGACHGGPESSAPRFARRDPRGGIDRRSTLANLEAFLEAVGPDRDAGSLASLLAVQHPPRPASTRLVAAPLTPRERLTLDTWLARVRFVEQRTISDPAVMQAGAFMPAADAIKSPAQPKAPGPLPASIAIQTPPQTAPAPLPRPTTGNRFKDLLESAANPPQLPPPQEPRGMIFPNDTPPAEEAEDAPLRRGR